MPANTATTPTRAIRHSPMEHPRHQYPQETEALQAIAQSCGLVETIKWGKPCFTMEGRNIALLQRFNEYIALLFFQGALLADPDKLLFRLGEHMQAPRQLRFRSVDEITRLAPTIRRYLDEAIALQRSGAKVPRKPAAEYEMPAELKARLDRDPALSRAFAALSPGRRKGYLIRIAAAKQSSTRASRVEKYAPQILAGKGLNE